MSWVEWPRFMRVRYASHASVALSSAERCERSTAQARGRDSRRPTTPWSRHVSPVNRGTAFDAAALTCGGNAEEDRDVRLVEEQIPHTEEGGEWHGASDEAREEPLCRHEGRCDLPAAVVA